MYIIALKMYIIDAIHYQTFQTFLVHVRVCVLTSY